MLALGLGTFLLSPFWSMAGLRLALCEGNREQLKTYADLNLWERRCLRAAKRRICKAADGSMLESAWQVYRTTEIEWLSRSTIQVTFLEKSGDELAVARFERKGLHWRMVDLDC
jgi:hypothetical protein